MWNKLLLKLAVKVVSYLIKRLNQELDTNEDGKISKTEVVDKINYIINCR